MGGDMTVVRLALEFEQGKSKGMRSLSLQRCFVRSGTRAAIRSRTIAYVSEKLSDGIAINVNRNIMDLERMIWDARPAIVTRAVHWTIETLKRVNLNPDDGYFSPALDYLSFEDELTSGTPRTALYVRLPYPG